VEPNTGSNGRSNSEDRPFDLQLGDAANDPNQSCKIIHLDLEDGGGHFEALKAIATGGQVSHDLRGLWAALAASPCASISMCICELRRMVSSETEVLQFWDHISRSPYRSIQSCYTFKIRQNMLSNIENLDLVPPAEC
jgi:hypothetical protein